MKMTTFALRCVHPSFEAKEIGKRKPLEALRFLLFMTLIDRSSQVNIGLKVYLLSLWCTCELVL
jgi:hypothetical protein